MSGLRHKNESDPGSVASAITTEFQDNVVSKEWKREYDDFLCRHDSDSGVNDEYVVVVLEQEGLCKGYDSAQSLSRWKSV